MEEYKFGNATVRIRGEVDKEKIEEAAKIFLTKVIQQKKKKEKNM